MFFHLTPFHFLPSFCFKKKSSSFGQNLTLDLGALQQFGLPDKGCAIKGLVVSVVRISEGKDMRKMHGSIVVVRMAIKLKCRNTP